MFVFELISFTSKFSPHSGPSKFSHEISRLVVIAKCTALVPFSFYFILVN